MALSQQDAQAIVQLGRELGVDPASLGGLMELESGINPNIWGGAGGKYRGLIQFGPGARQEVGLPSKQMTIAEQIPYVKKYFQQRGFKPGEHGVTEMYRTVLVGNPYQSGTDTFGTESDSAAKRMLPGGDLYERARVKLEGGVGGPLSAVAGQAPAHAPGQEADAGTEALSQVLLGKYIDALSKKGKSGVDPGLKAPALPSYEEEDASADELSVLLKAYEGSEKQKEAERMSQQQQANSLAKNLIASEAAKNQLFAQAVGAFATPKSVI